MLTTSLTRSFLHLFFLILVLLSFTPVIAQDTILPRTVVPVAADDSLHRMVNIDSLKTSSLNPDTLVTDSLMTDSLSIRQRAKQMLSTTVDSLRSAKKSPLTSVVDYSATDSIRFEIKGQKVFLYNTADIKYEDIRLNAHFIEIDFPNNKVSASGITDSNGVRTGKPEFKQGDQSFTAEEINYNYTSKRGYINTVFTKQDEGYLHGTVVKKMENNVTYIKSGTYTTCDKQDHAHFGFRFNKGKVIPGKRVITGPAYMEIAGVATPLMIPFGFFPNRTGQRSGILLPTYGESRDRGFFFENFGYYQAINDYMDFQVLADIYTRGSWAVKPTFRYNRRYRFNGGFNFSYAVNVLGAADSPDYQKRKDFQIRWNHSQDGKARPRSNFSANVNIVSNSFNKYDLSASTQSYLSNTFQSSVNYATNWAGKYYLNLNFNHSQNTVTKAINITLPQLAFSVNQFYPFRRANPVGKMRWYEQISMKYTMDAENRYNATDTTFLRGNWKDEMQNGMRHNVPVSGSFRLLKYFNWSNSINFNDRMYIESYRRYFQSDTLVENGDTIVPGYKSRYVPGFVNAFDFSFSTSINTRLYGMYQFRGRFLKAIRHMITPSVSFSYTPDWGAPALGYYRYIENDTTTVNPVKYSIFEGSLYGGPPGQKSGNISFSISNNLEMKVRNRKDTITGVRKIALIDDFSIRCSYDVARDSLNWSPIYMSGRTSLSNLIKGLSIQYASTWDMYARGAAGQRINITEWKATHRLIRLDNTTWDLGFSYSLSSDKAKGKKTTTRGTEGEQRDLDQYYDYYVDFDIPWSFSFNYNFHYGKAWVAGQSVRASQLTQTFNFNGQLNITPKWKVTVTSGWDFVNNQISYTSIDVYRDLHCWEMRFGWVPKGARQSWNFSINAKASLLQDLKLNKKRDFRDL